MADKKNIVIFGGGTRQWLDSHLALTAPAGGATAHKLAELCSEMIPEMNIKLYLTKLAGGPSIDTPDDVSNIVDQIVNDDVTKIVFFPIAMLDYEAEIEGVKPGKYEERLSTSERPEVRVDFKSRPKVIKKIRKTRKDIFLVGFKQTCGLTEDEQYIEGLKLCKNASCNLVLANDVKTRLNMIVTPEEARYHITTDRNQALKGLVQMAKLRSHLTFTRSTVISGDSVPWNSPEVPDSLRTVVNYCIEKGAYKVFKASPESSGTTVGHFAVKLDDKTFLTSKRRTNFNDLNEIGLVKIETDGPDTVIAYGSKPSVGGQSQRIIFSSHQTLDCILHFHCPLKDLNDPDIPQVSQYEVECGSHQCGDQTAKGLKKIGNLYVVYLKEHGPNIVFNRDIDPQEVIKFIEDKFDLSQKTGGFVSIKSRLETPSTLEDATNFLT